MTNADDYGWFTLNSSFQVYFDADKGETEPGRMDFCLVDSQYVNNVNLGVNLNYEYPSNIGFVVTYNDQGLKENRKIPCARVKVNEVTDSDQYFFSIHYNN